MFKRGTGTLGALVALALVTPLLGEKEPSRKAQIRVVVPGGRYLVRVDVWVLTSEDPLFVPYCGKQESGREVLCTRAAWLEQQTQQGWRKAEVKGSTVSPGRDPREAEGVLIPPRSKRPFSFTFDTDVLGISPGTRLRVVVQTWSNENSVRAGDAPTRMTSPEFVCPPE
jgi:hypothetical protein